MPEVGADGVEHAGVVIVVAVTAPEGLDSTKDAETPFHLEVNFVIQAGATGATSHGHTIGLLMGNGHQDPLARG